MISLKPRLYHYRVWSSYLPLLECCQQNFFLGSSDQSCVVYGGVSGDVWCIVCVAPFKNGRTTGGFIYEHVNGRRLRLWEQRGIQMKETARRCLSHHLCSEVHISSPCSLLILCYLYLRSSINMQNSQMIKFPSQELQGKTDYSVDLRWRQTLMAFLIDHRRAWGNHLCGASAPAGREQTGAFSVSVLALYHMTRTTSIPAWHTHPSYYVVASV